jgi:hypothetical protein
MIRSFMRSVAVRYCPKFYRGFLGSLLVATMAASVLAGCGGASSPHALPFIGSQNAAIAGSGSAPTQALSSLSSASACDKHKDHSDGRHGTKNKNDDPSDCSPSPVPSASFSPVPSPLPSSPVGSAKQIYVTVGNTVRTYDQYGTQTPLTITGLYGSDFGITVDGAGKIYTTSFVRFSSPNAPPYGTNTVATYDSNGAQTTPTITIAGMFPSLGIAVDAAGKIYVLSGNVVKTYNPDGTQTTPTITADSPGVFASGIAVDAAGKIYVTSGNTVTTYNPNGTQTTPTIAVNGPAGIAVDAAGKIYVTSGSNNSIVTTYNPDGTQTTPTITAGLNQPLGIAVDAAGKIYVANGGNSTVTTYNPNGTQTTPTITAGLNGPPSGIAVR